MLYAFFCQHMAGILNDMRTRHLAKGVSSNTLEGHQEGHTQRGFDNKGNTMNGMHKQNSNSSLVTRWSRDLS